MIVPKSKTDIYRRENTVLIAKAGNKLCPVTFLLRYINSTSFSKNSKEYLSTSIQFCKRINEYKLFNRFKPLSYTRAREILLDTLNVLGYDKSLFSLHSLGSGGVSMAAQNNDSERLL